MKKLEAYSEDGKSAIKCVSGKTYDVPDMVAKQWLKRESCIEVKQAKKKDVKK